MHEQDKTRVSPSGHLEYSRNVLYIHRINKIAHNSVQETSSKTIFKVQVKKCYIRIKQFNLVHINHPLSDKNLY